ncbi:MAG: hypothetical protein V3S44_01760, partial [Alphaproteobacteria bacterium]
MKSTLHHRALTTAIAAALLGVTAIAGPAQAQKIISMTAVDGYPPRALQVRTFIEFFIPEVDKRLKANGNQYKIRWNKAFSGQIVK